MYSLEEIFLIASNDRYASKMDSSSYESSMLYGIKIVKDETTSEIQIFSTYGDHYKEIDKESYEIFLNNGWRYVDWEELSWEEHKDDTAEQIWQSKLINCHRMTNLLLAKYEGEYLYIEQGEEAGEEEGGRPRT